MFFDRLIAEFDVALQSVSGVTAPSRPSPGLVQPERALNPEEQAHAAGLMRVNHVGEVCAQALYQAQALSTTDPALAERFRVAAQEERDHLAWTAQRLDELGARPSLLNPLWYAGAFALGLVAGRSGDKVSLGFMAETERQVEQHLDSHLDKLPAADSRSRAIVEQMKIDEVKHAEAAIAAGGMAMPAPVRETMRMMARVMTTTAYRI